MNEKQIKDCVLAYLLNQVGGQIHVTKEFVENISFGDRFNIEIEENSTLATWDVRVKWNLK